jgi:hypothetical protein
MTPEEAYDEALRRIREAERTGAVELEPGGLKQGKTGLEPSELATFESTSAGVGTPHLAYKITSS